MKQYLKLTSAFFLFFCLTLGARAQQYPLAGGIKFGAYEVGPSIKYFYDENTALEGVLGFRSGGAVFTGLWEKHMEAFNVSELNFYYGFGGHVGGGGARYRRIVGNTYERDKGGMLLGADGVLGLEYVFPEAPFAISLDLNPRVELINGSFFDIAPGLGIKYLFR
ncbi:MAG: hypothetical protein INR69_16710 [Mucilaginibacter polytrichastri]|nr:hypothetical protein [Mucilaginibacter polytrichastri]